MPRLNYSAVWVLAAAAHPAREFFCMTVVLRLFYGSKFQAWSRPGGSEGYRFVLRLYYACATGANFKPGAGRRVPGKLFCTTVVLRLYYGGKFQARSRPGGAQGYFLVLRLYYACTTGANFKPGAGQEEPRRTFWYYVCTTLVLREQI